MKEILIQLVMILTLIVEGQTITYERAPEPFAVIEPLPPLETPLILTPTLKSEAQETWLADLIICESHGNPEAINPLDRDGTPSYGLLQFKPSTFTGYRKQYGLKEAELMNPEAQKETVRHMMKDPNVNWYQLFPACTRRLGEPPAW